MNDRHPDLDDLIRAHRKGVRLTSEQHGKNRARVLARAAAGAAVATGIVGTSSTAVGTAVTQGAAALVAKIVMGLVVVGGAGTAYYVSRHTSPVESSVGAEPARAPAQETPAIRAPEPQVPALPAEPPSDPGSPPPGAVDVNPSGASGRTAAKAKTEAASSLASEVQLLHDVEAALQAGQPARALQLLDSQRGGRYSGAMGEERAAARIVTLCRLGRVDEARSEAARFVHDRPRSPLVPRVRSTCAQGSESPSDGVR